MQKKHVKNKYFVPTELYFALLSIKPKKTWINQKCIEKCNN